ncbi:hypothetical protein [Halarcobacter sp.]|uniref:hypothetical protein n=1 Tax=Halarcobacter sp. TaxID=2321133 RepID=UPI002AA64575|nr:hypothetical protein [Halarcobacter sp.]
MFRKILLSSLTAFAIIGCGGGGGSGGFISSNSEQSTLVTVERGSVLNGIVTDSLGQKAIWNKGTNTYTFEKAITYPIKVTGGFVDIDNDGIKNNSDFDLDIELKSSNGKNITLLTTVVFDEDENIEKSNKEYFINEFLLDEDDILKLPSSKKRLALLSNIIYKNLELNSTLNLDNIMTLISSGKLDIKTEYENTNLNDYSNLSPSEFLEENEKKMIKDIEKIKASKSNLPNYSGDDITSTTIINKQSAYISPQCYTKTEDAAGKIYNPCFSCHINSQEPNYIDDWDLQESYAFNANSYQNPFTNSFKDRTSLVDAISDEDILEYINVDNYKNNQGDIILASKLKYDLPSKWDFSQDGIKDGVWSGYVPDCFFNFDSEGFDLDNNGSYTGWRAFAYSPFLGTFWPTNGSTDDVLIRLPKFMREDSNGNFSKEVYKINLAIVESMIKKDDVALDFQVDESKYEVDLNHNGIFDSTSVIIYKWDTSNIVKKDYYVGLAKDKLEAKELHIAPGLYPKGTEFLHSVRYIGINDDKSGIKLAKRMKELRYGKKTSWNTYSQLYNAALSEIKEKHDFPDRLKTINGNIEAGLQTGLGWRYQGFIEDINGNLRPQSYEETLSCIGCHSGIGAITDTTFAFPRKDNSYKNGWYHWSQKDLVGLKDRILSNGKGEYAFYLEQNKAGDEFRGNQEIKDKFFDSNGDLIQSEVDKIKDDISYLIYPSVQRAIMLNKAYKVIVDEQSYIYGKDAHIEPLNDTVFDEVIIDKSTGISAIKY